MMTGAELVTRLHLTLKPRGGQVISAVLRGRAAWVLLLSANRRPTVAYLTSRPSDDDVELVTTCEPYADAVDCPVSLAAAAWMLETEPSTVTRAVRDWRRQVAAKDTRPLSMSWSTR